MFYSEDHLRITKVRTADGVSPLMEGERVAKKIITAPLNAVTKKAFEDQNSRLPTPLKMKIEVVKAYKPEAIPEVPGPDVNELQRKIDELTKLKAELQAQKTGVDKNIIKEPVQSENNGTGNKEKNLQNANSK